MIDIQLDIDVKRISKGLERDFNDIADYRVPLKRSGVVMLASTDKNFRNESTPDGKPWKPLKPATIKRRRKKGKGAKILQDTGGLKASPQFKAISKALLKISAIRKSEGVDIAGVHQFGAPKRKIPKRSFLGFSVQDADDIVRVFSQWVAEKLKAR